MGPGMDLLYYPPGISFRHNRFLQHVYRDVLRRRGQPNPTDESDILSRYSETASEYAAQLKQTVDSDLKATASNTHKRDPSEVGGPGIEFDLVELVLTATGLAGGYLVWTEVAKDVRAAASTLRRLSRRPVIIDANASIILAVDAVAAPGTFADIYVQFVAPIKVLDEYGLGLTEGYLVGLDVTGSFRLVLVAPNGDIVGVNDSLSALNFYGLKLPKSSPTARPF